MISATRIQVKKLHEDAIIPKRAHKPDAGFDMTCISVNDTDKFIEYGTGIAMHIPEGYVGLIFPRSSVTKKDASPGIVFPFPVVLRLFLQTNRIAYSLHQRRSSFWFVPLICKYILHRWEIRSEGR